MTSAPQVSDAYEYTAAMLMERAGVCADTLTAHIRAGILEQGVYRPGVGRKRFWTRAQANGWLRRIGKTHLQFER